MKRLLLSCALLCLPALGFAQVHALPDAPHLLVMGHAEVRYVPDRFTINLTVHVTDMVPDIARRKVEEHMQHLLKALDDAGAMKGKTQASTLSIQPETDYRDGKDVFLGTGVKRTVSATFDDLDRLRAFIAKVPAGKEVQIAEVDTARSDIDAIESMLREQAMANSREAARKIAASYGMTISGVYSVSEVAPEFSYGVQAGSWGEHGGSQGPQTIVVTGSSVKVSPNVAVLVGSKTAQQNIYAVYLIAPKRP